MPDFVRQIEGNKIPYNRISTAKYVLTRNVCINQYLYFFTIITLQLFLARWVAWRIKKDEKIKNRGDRVGEREQERAREIESG